MLHPLCIVLQDSGGIEEISAKENFRKILKVTVMDWYSKHYLYVGQTDLLHILGTEMSQIFF